MTERKHCLWCQDEIEGGIACGPKCFDSYVRWLDQVWEHLPEEIAESLDFAKELWYDGYMEGRSL